MINQIAVFNSAKNQFSSPTLKKDIVNYISKSINEDPNNSLLNDVYSVLIRHWQKNNWSWSDFGAVQLKDTEEVIFDDKKIILIDVSPNVDKDISVNTIKYNEKHERIKWF